MRVFNAVLKYHTSGARPTRLVRNTWNIPKTIASPGKRKMRHKGCCGSAHITVSVNTKLTSKISAMVRILLGSIIYFPRRLGAFALAFFFGLRSGGVSSAAGCPTLVACFWRQGGSERFTRRSRRRSAGPPSALGFPPRRAPTVHLCRRSQRPRRVADRCQPSRPWSAHPARCR